VFGADPAPGRSRGKAMATQKPTSNPGQRQHPGRRAHTAADGVGRPSRVPDRARSQWARVGLRKLAAGVGIAAVALLHTGAAPRAGAVSAPGTARFVDHGGPILHAARIHLLYWGSAWTATAASAPTPDQITASVRWMLTGPYLTGLAEYRGIRPAVLRGFTVVTSSDPHDGFGDEDVSDFLDAQLDAGVVPGPDPDNQTLYVVVIPVGVSAGGDSAKNLGEHSYYPRHGQRIPFAWTADSGSLAAATRILSHELVEALTDPQGSAVLGVSGTCEQAGWCEIADICPGAAVVNGVAVDPYWSERARTCVAIDLASSTVPPQPRTARGAAAPNACPTSVPRARPRPHRPTDTCQ
jgi:hypothetical protein